MGFLRHMRTDIRTTSGRAGAKHAFLCCGLLGSIFQTCYGQQNQVTPRQTNEKIHELAILAQTQSVDTPIGSGDLLHIEVFDVPELSRDVRVSDVGQISYPLIPTKIQAAGLTTFQLEETMAELLIQNGLVSHPQISVFIKEQVSQPISIVGAVVRPMVYQVVRPTTLLEVLTAAGGIADNAGNFVIITRAGHPATAKSDAGVSNSGTDAQIITIRLQDLLESGNPVYNIQVFGGDVISVPAGGIVYVTGAGVAQPGGYILQNHGEQITVLKAIALAHGLTGFAKADQAVIMRSNPVTGQKDIIPVRIKQIENQKTDDVKMNSNDILYVPDSVGLKVLARGAEAAVSVGSGIAIYRGGP